MPTRCVAILKETGDSERRVIVVPRDVPCFTDVGLDVIVQRGAGEAIGLADEKYRAVGADIVEAGEAWAAPVAVKYKAPLPEEYGLLRPDLHLGAIFHAEGDLSLVRALQHSGVTAYSYEMFRTPDGVHPLAAPGGEIAGRMAVLYAAYHLQHHLGGAGVLLGAIPGSRPARVTVIGHGNVGGAAARTATALGAQVTVFGRRQHALRAFAGTIAAGVQCRLLTQAALEEILPCSEVVIGAILESTWDTPALVPSALVARMPPGAVLVDATAGYGPGYLPTFDRHSTAGEPVFERHGVLHCKFDSLPKFVPVTAAYSLSAVAAPYLAAMARAALFEEHDPVSAAGRIIAGGRIVHPVVERHAQMDARRR